VVAGADDDTFTSDGMRVGRVIPDGMAARAGVMAGDTITAIAGLPVRTPSELAVSLRRAGACATASLAVSDRVASVVVDRCPCAPAVACGELAVADGSRLRTFTTAGRAPTLLYVPGIARETAETVSLAARGHATLRFDHRGVGDSEGDASDFVTELADLAAVLATLAGPVVLVAHSVGALAATQLLPDPRVAGVIAYGAFAEPWLQCVAGSIRRQLARDGAAPDEIARQLARVATAGHSGRSAAYHAQLAAIDPAAAWARVTVPLVLGHGEHDLVAPPDSPERIAALVRGPVACARLPGGDHYLDASAIESLLDQFEQAHVE
jgi:pimeloyl-ACP methyl ester carboxylesterase